jgi:hypothetical protein
VSDPFAIAEAPTALATPGLRQVSLDGTATASTLTGGDSDAGVTETCSWWRLRSPVAHYRQTQG